MREKTIRLLSRIFAAVAVFSTIFAKPVYGKDYTGRLKESLQTSPVYYVTTALRLNIEFDGDKTGFGKEYADRCVAIGGNIKIQSVSADNTRIVISDIGGNKCTIDTSAPEVAASVRNLAVGDNVVIYGKIAMTTLPIYDYKIIAHRVDKGTAWLTAGDLVSYPNEKFYSRQVDDLKKDKSVKYRIPATWNSGYVKSDLTNNGIKGYQYSLNALAPQHLDYPEIFYIFYFNNETHLEIIPEKPSDSDLRKIEKAIIKNILEPVGEDKDPDIKVDSFKDANGTKFHYCPVSYRAKDGNDYRLEFLFRPDDKGIVCMLYLYYPREEAVHHIKEVTYLIDSMTVENAVD